MNIEQRARQQLAEVESAYEFHTRQAFNSDDERDEHIEAAGDCMIAADMLRDLLSGEPEPKHWPHGVSISMPTEFFEHLLNCMANTVPAHEPNKDVIWAAYHRARDLLHKGVQPVAWYAPASPENESASQETPEQAKSRRDQAREEIARGDTVHLDDCCNVEPVRTGGSVSPDQASEAVQQTVNPITFDAIHTAIRRAAGWTDTLHADSLIFKFARFVANELGAPIPKGTEPAPVAAEDKPASVPSFADLSNALFAALDTNGVELHPAIARGVTCSAAEHLGIPVPKAPATK